MSYKRRVFYSFHYEPDNWRAAKIRNIGAIEGNKPLQDNHWEEIVNAGEEKIRNWIEKELENRSCTIVLIGPETANRYWINHEIARSWNRGLGVTGIYIHGISNKDGETSIKGQNPFDYVNFKNGVPLSSTIKCYEPAGWTSPEKYAWIANNLSNIVEEAINIRNSS
jgi:hypothetical protein